MRDLSKPRLRFVAHDKPGQTIRSNCGVARNSSLVALGLAIALLLMGPINTAWAAPASVRSDGDGVGWWALVAFVGVAVVIVASWLYWTSIGEGGRATARATAEKKEYSTARKNLAFGPSWRGVIFIAICASFGGMADAKFREERAQFERNAGPLDFYFDHANAVCATALAVPLYCLWVWLNARFEAKVNAKSDAKLVREQIRDEPGSKQAGRTPVDGSR